MEEFKAWLEQKDAKHLFIMRGPPGSGKSFEVKKIIKEFGICAEGHVFGTDEFLEKTGDYKGVVQKAIAGGYFGPMMCKFHKMNQERAAKAMQTGINPVIIDNTNLTISQMRPYVEAGVAYGYEVHFVEPSSEHWQRISPLLNNKALNRERIKWAAMKLVDKNTHGVPFDSMMKYLNQWHVGPRVQDF